VSGFWLTFDCNIVRLWVQAVSQVLLHIMQQHVPSYRYGVQKLAFCGVVTLTVPPTRLRENFLGQHHCLQLFIWLIDLFQILVLCDWLWSQARAWHFMNILCILALQGFMFYKNFAQNFLWHSSMAYTSEVLCMKTSSSKWCFMLAHNKHSSVLATVHC
jgi:hypothetical protein